MSGYIDADKYRKDLLSAYDDVSMEFEVLDRQPLVQAIPLDKVKKAREQIIDEKDFAYADFERYKQEVLCVEPDELPDDDFRYGMERCLEILDKLIESEGVRNGK